MPARAASPWLDSIVPHVVSDAIDDLTAPVWDVLIVGAGIVGLCAATTLADSGRSVCIIEASTVGAGTTGSATAKVSSSHGVVASRVAKRHGFDLAVRYQQANDRGFRWLTELVATLPDDVGWSQVDHVVHGFEASDVLDATFHIAAASASHPQTIRPPVWSRGRAITWGRTALVQPVSLSRALARRLRSNGVRIREGVSAVAAREVGSLMHIRLDSGSTLRARQVIISTGVPVVDPEFLVPRMSFAWHVAAAIPLEGEVATTLDVDGSGVSTRPARLADGRQVAIVVGPECALDEIASGQAASRLSALASPWFDLGNATHLWSARDGRSPGELPIAARSRRSPRVLLITGMNAWGFTNAAAIGRELPRLLSILEADSDRTQPIEDLWTKGLAISPVTLLGTGLHTAGSLTRGLLSAMGREAAAVAEGSGVVVGGPLNPRAVCRTSDGVLRTVSARCTHAGCVVEWNAASQCWSCPCHASQFAPDGSVLSGPATRPLPPVAE